MNWLHFAPHIGAALLMGMAIGLERQWRVHTAGLRTNTLVTVGAAMFVSLARLMEKDGSPTRIAAQVVSGIGFLGGGVIFREGLSVHGMNTAATLWCAGAVGALAGAGLFVEAAIATAAVLLVHTGLRPVALRMEARLQRVGDVETHYRLRVICHHPQEAVIRTVFLRHVGSQPRMTLQGLATQEAEQDGTATVTADVQAAERNDRFMEDVVARIAIEPGVTSVSWEKVLP